MVRGGGHESYGPGHECREPSACWVWRHGAWVEAVGPESEHCGLLLSLSSVPLSSLSPPIHLFSACV